MSLVWRTKKEWHGIERRDAIEVLTQCWICTVPVSNGIWIMFQVDKTIDHGPAMHFVDLQDARRIIWSDELRKEYVKGKKGRQGSGHWRHLDPFQHAHAVGFRFPNKNERIWQSRFVSRLTACARSAHPSLSFFLVLSVCVNLFTKYRSSVIDNAGASGSQALSPLFVAGSTPSPC